MKQNQIFYIVVVVDLQFDISFSLAHTFKFL